MEKRIAIVTGATGGIGKEWVKALIKEDLDEIWAIARRKDILTSLAKEYPDKVVPISLDLTNEASIDELGAKLDASNVTIVWMVNNAGMGKTSSFVDENITNLRRCLSLNAGAVMSLSYFALKHMKKGSYLVNVGSQAGRQPAPYLTIYAATKSFVNDFTAALHYEYKNKGINCMAVTPYWVESDMLNSFDNGRKVKFGMVSKPEDVVARAIKDAKRGKVYSINKSSIRALVFFQRFIPEKIQMKIWKKQVSNLCEIK